MPDTDPPLASPQQFRDHGASLCCAGLFGDGGAVEGVAVHGDVRHGRDVVICHD